MDVLICTGDRDAFQLVSDRVTVLYPTPRRLRDGPDDARQRRGQVRRVAARATPSSRRCVGETSDNLPGVPGVGPKTAAKWIKQYGDLDDIIAHVDQIKGKAGDSSASTSAT